MSHKYNYYLGCSFAQVIEFRTRAFCTLILRLLLALYCMGTNKAKILASSTNTVKRERLFMTNTNVPFEPKNNALGPRLTTSKFFKFGIYLERIAIMGKIKQCGLEY